MKKTLTAIITAALLPAAVLCGCSSQDVTAYSKTIYNTFGTEATLALYGDFNSSEAQESAKQFGAEVQDYLAALEEELDASTQAFNSASAGETVTLTQSAYNVLSLALEIYNQTGGYYNAGVYSLVDLYGFSSRFDTYTYCAEYKEEYDRTYTATAEDGTQTTYATAAQLPAQEYITAFTELCTCFGDIQLDSTNLTATKPQKTVTVNGTEYSLKIDLGGIAKGYAADEINARMVSAGYEYGYFTFGSSSMYISKSYNSEDGKIELTVRNPRDYSYFMSVRAADTAVSTSGDYERAYSFYGVRFCHIINPYTGLPVNVEYSGGTYSQTAGIISATVLGGSAAENDARTTALMAMGLERAIDYMNSQDVIAQNLQIYLVYLTADGSMQLITNVAEGNYTLTDTQNFTVASTVGADGKVTYTG